MVRDECVSVCVNLLYVTADTLLPCPTAGIVPLILYGPWSVCEYQCLPMRACVRVLILLALVVP
jgi:hypothetical protein